MKQTVVIAAALSLGMLTGCSSEKRDQAAQAPPAVQVESEGGVSLITVDRPNRFPIVTATEYSAASTLKVTGTVNPDISRQIPVISIASGRVVAIHTIIGAYVKKGQLLMEVQSTDISNAFDQYLKAVNDERLARTQDERAKILYEKGAIAKSQLEIADDGEQDAKTDLTAAEQQLIVLGVDKNHPSLTAKVYSPATGVVISQNVTNAAATGVTFAGSATAFTIADLSQVWIICDVYENDLPMVHLGQTADIRLNAYPDHVITGTIGEIDAVLDPSIRTAKVRIQVPNPDRLMRLGMFATATFHGRRPEAHAAVPASAILHLHDRDWVYVPAGEGKFRRVGVVGGDMIEGGRQEIKSGLTVGQQVVTNALELQNSVEQ
ncbi:MAG: efflux RND transporter periplasmic adaptor subunit [Acidobacteriaceae bacterium]|jgi:cobalt-zinc-cadmium efflux system membrane fusion protein